MYLNDIIEFAIKWGPTILFAIGLILGIFLGYIRGYRKSIIFLIHSICAGLLCFIGFLIVIRFPIVEEKIFMIIDSIIKLFGTSISELLSLSSNVNSLHSLFSEYINNNLSNQDMFMLFVTNNFEYIETLIDLGVHIVIALLFYILYFIVSFLLYLVYLLFYSDRKQKKKQKCKYMMGASLERYSKKRGLGALISGSRACVVGLIGLSFLGTLFFVLAGGKGDKKAEDLTVGNSTINSVITAYNSIGSYGETGIFKIMNAISNKEDVPYYLLATDLIFSGGLVDEDLQYEGNIYFREELASYIGFARDTFNLMLKYDNNQEIKKIINKDSSKEPIEVITELIKIEEFNKEFNELIEQFDGKNYVINLSFSLANTIIKNIDQLNSELSPEVKGLFDIFFKGDNALKITDIITRDDARTLLKMVLAFLDNNLEEENKKNEILYYLDKFLPHIKNLSIMKNQNKFRKIDPLLSSAFEYVINNVITNEESNEEFNINDIMKNISLENDSINWYDELQQIIAFLDDGLYFYFDLYLPFNEGEDTNILNFIFNVLFNNSDENIKEKNEDIYDNLIYFLSNSKLISKVLSSSFVYQKLEDVLLKSLNIEMPNTIIYQNTYLENGQLKSYGEIYNLLTSFKLLASNDELKNIFLNLDFSKVDLELVKTLSTVLTSPISSKVKTTYIEQLLSSKILHYAVSGLLMNTTFTSDETSTYMRFYLPEKTLSYEFYNKKQYFYVQKNNLLDVFSSLPKIVELLEPIMNGQQINIDNLLPILMSDDIYDLIKLNPIIEGTLSNIILNNFKNIEAVTMPQSMLDPEKWLSNSTKKGEILSIIKGLKETDIDLSSMINSTDFSIETVKSWNLNEESALSLLESKILYYTISTQIYKMENNESFEIIIPYDAINNNIDEYDLNNKKLSIISKNEIVELFILALDFIPENGENININKIFKNKESLLQNAILHATLIRNIMKHLNDSPIEIPSNFISDSTVENLKSNQNVWFTTNELMHLLNALDVIFNISSESFDIKNIEISKVQDAIFKLNEISEYYDEENKKYFTKLEICTSSLIVLNTLTKELDKVLVPNIIDEKTLNAIKINEMYDSSEISSLIRTFDVLDVKDLSSISLDLIKEQLMTIDKEMPEYNNRKKLNILYDSKIIALALSKQLDNIFTNLKLSPNVISYIKYTVGDNKGAYKEEEIYSLLSAIKVLNITDINKINDFDFKSNIKGLNEYLEEYSKTKLEVIYDSIILKAVITRTVDELLSSNEFLVEDFEAKEYYFNTQLSFYKLKELQVFVELLDTLNSVDEFNISNLTLDELVSYANRSILLHASISKFIIDQFIVPKDLVVNEKIVSEEFNKFFNSIKAFGLNNLEVFKISIPNAQAQEIVFESVIMRATITSTIKQDSSNKLLIEDSLLFVTKTIAYNNTEILILSNSELSNIIKSLQILLGEDVNTFAISLSLNQILSLTEQEMNAIFESNLISILVSNLLPDKNTLPSSPLLPEVPEKTEEVSVYDLTNLSLSNIKIYNKESIQTLIAIINMLKELGLY